MTKCPSCGIDKEDVAKSLDHLEKEVKVLLTMLTDKQAIKVLELKAYEDWLRQGR